MRRTIAILAVELLTACGLLLGQGVNSSILGRVTDTTGAPVPGVKITVTNTQTGIAVHAVTGQAGNYSVPELISGTYAVMGTKQGFARRTVSGIQVLSSSHVRVDLVLKVGSVTQHISVVGHTPLVQTDTTNISSSVTTRQLNNLPTSLQTIDTFLGLAAGVQSLNGDASNPPIGGSTHWGSVNFTLNGVGANQPGNGGGADIQSTGLLVLPPPSSMKELKVQSDNMSAKYKGKANVNLVLKNGTNHFHGELFEYVQNTSLNANSFVNNAKGIERPPEHLNQFGGNFGGPIKHDKAFFFVDYNGYRQINSATVQHNLPTAAQRSGDFGAQCTSHGASFDANGVCTNTAWQLYDPATGNPFPNNQVPDGMITSQAKALMQYVPLPTDANSPGNPGEANNYFGLTPKKRNVNSVDARIDYNLSEKDRLFGVYAQRATGPWWTSNSNFVANYGNGRQEYKLYTLTASETHTFNANTLNTLRLAWGDYIQRFQGQNTDFNLQTLFPSSPATLYFGLPQITATGYNGLPKDTGAAHAVPQWDVEITDDFTHIHGKHTIEAGIDETGYKIFNRHPAETNNTGLFKFNGYWTGGKGWPSAVVPSNAKGNAFADFLLGNAQSSLTPTTGVYGKMIYSRQWGLYVQDTWQVRPNLTINYGLRYEYQTRWKYRNANQVTGFSPAVSELVLPQNSTTATFPTDGALQGFFDAYPYVTTQSLGLPLQLVQPDKNNFAPRFGFAWRPFGGTRTVFRGGYGVYYNLNTAYTNGQRWQGFNPPWNYGVTEPFTTELKAKGKNPTTGYLPDITFGNPFPSTNTNGVVVSPNPLLRYFQPDFKSAVIQEWNATIEHQFGANWMVRASYVGSQSHHLPYNSDALNVPAVQTPDVSLLNQHPFQYFNGTKYVPWGNINSYRSAGKQNFNQLQLGVRHRFASGFSFQAQYQFTRSLDNVPNSGGPLNWHFGNRAYGNTSFIRRNYLVFDYLYELPFGRGRRYFSGAHGWEDALVGGWQVSGITHYAGGVPLSVNVSMAGTGIVGWWPTRADVVDRNQLYVTQQSGHNVIGGVQWFNPLAVAVPTQFTYGNSDRDMIWGPGYENWDMSAMKTFHVTEGLGLQFRRDFLNAFNHFNLGNPNMNLPDLRDNGNNNANFAKITGGGGGRTIQFALKLMF